MGGHTCVPTTTAVVRTAPTAGALLTAGGITNDVTAGPTAADVCSDPRASELHENPIGVPKEPRFGNIACVNYKEFRAGANDQC